jgi:HK97 family phage portal protein
MSLRTRLAEGFANISKALVGGYESPNSVFAFNQLYGSYGDTKKLGKYRGIVFAAVNLISDDVGRYIPIFNKKQSDNHLEPIQSHPFLDLLEHPSKDVSRSEFLKAAETYYDILGEAFWYIPLGNFTGKPNIQKGTEIVLLPPDKMGVKIGDKGEVIGYTLRKSDGKEVLFKPEEIGLDKTFNPLNPYRGYGIVEAAIDYIETEESTRTFTKNFFRNNASPAGIISIKGNISKENFQIFARKWREQYEGVKNAGRTALIRQSEIDFTKTSLGLDQIDMQALKDLTVGEVLRMFRVPKALLGEETQQGFGRASVETLEYIFAAHTIEPRMQKLDGFIQMLLNRYYPGEQLIVTHKDIIPKDKVFELEQRKAGVDNWLTRNEIRQEDGLEDIPGGEVLRAPIVSVPLEGEVGPADNKNIFGNGKGTITITKVVKKKTNKELTYEAKEGFRIRLLKNQLLYEKRFRKALKPILDDQKKEALRNWRKANEKGINGVVKRIEDTLIDLDEANRAFENALVPVEFALAEEQGRIALEFAGATDTDFVITPEIEKFIRDAVSKMAANYNEQTLKDLGVIIADGLSAGDSIAQISRDLESAFIDIEGYRADRIASTETLRASNEATRMAYKQTGYVTGMQWFANPGACAECEEMAGRPPVGLDETFADLGDTVGDLDVNYTNIETPPLHPNCQCTITPIRE